MNISWIPLLLSCISMNLSVAGTLNLTLPEKEANKTEDFRLKWREDQKSEHANLLLNWQQKETKYKQQDELKPFRYCCNSDGVIYRSYRQHVTHPAFPSFDKDSGYRQHFWLDSK